MSRSEDEAGIIKKEAAMKKQAFNPFLPSYEYIPDGEPHVFGDRVYLYGSHDKFNGISFCLNDYVCWSAPLSDLGDWRFEGYIYHKNQDGRKYHGFLNSMFAPDVCRGADGRYYLYYFIGYNSLISVAVCDEPAGHYEFLGFVKYADGQTVGSKGEPLQFDPGVFVDNDGRVYLYTGFGPDKASPFMIGKKPTRQGAMCFELEEDMLTVKGDLTYIGVPANSGSQGTDYQNGHAFFEASSMRKFNTKYYFVYSSFLGHELCYATSDSPKGPFRFGGTLVSNGDIGLGNHRDPKSASDFTGNTHGSVIELNGEYYVFYHRQTNRHQFSRQACCEHLIMREDGSFEQAERTSCGLNGEPLEGRGTYEARIACHLTAKNGDRFYTVVKGLKGKEPYFTQTGKDREDRPDQYIANVTDGTTIGFKYFDFQDLKAVSVRVKGTGSGTFKVLQAENGPEIGSIPVTPSKEYQDFGAAVSAQNGVTPLYFRYEGSGHVDINYFTLS